MLEQLRKSGASIFIYLIFGLLIVIFVINFAPNAGQGPGGCAGGGSTVLAVDGDKVSQSSYKIAYSGNQYSGRQKTYVALEMLIRRELLAQAAEERGVRATGELVDEAIKQGYFFLGGQRIQLGQQIFDEVEGERYFNFGKLKNWANMLNVSLNSYKEEQTRGLQAAMMAELLQDSVQVSREEALSNYLFENTTVTYDAVSFSPAAYRAAMRLTDADVQRFLAAHGDLVKKKYDDEARTYKATKPALKLRSIFIAKAAPTAPAAPADPTKPAPADQATPTPAAAPQPGTMPIEEAKAKLEAARAAIAAGKQKFEDAARQLATDEAAKASGGEIGWRSVENAQLGDPAVNDAVKALKPGEMTPVVTTDAGAYLVMAEDQREGDLSFDQVKAEIAAELAKDLWSKEAAKRAALDALKTARAGTGKNLDELFEREANSDQERRRMQEMYEKMRGQTGAIVRESDDIPAAWTEDTEAPAAGGGSPAPAGSAAPAPAAGSAAPAPAAGSAAPAPAAGNTAEPSASAPASPAPAPAAELAPSDDVLPAFGEVARPKAISQGPTPRLKQLPVVGANKEASAALFDELSIGMLAGRVYEADGNYVLLQVKEKSAPKVEDFDKVAEDEIKQLRDVRAAVAVEQWLKGRCEELAKDGKIEPMPELIRETDDQGKPLPTVYRPCMSFR